MTVEHREPSYLKLFTKGELTARVCQAVDLLKDCRLCPRECRVDRLSGETGFCRTGIRAGVAAFHPHFGEEAPLVGSAGSGTIFFSSCNLLCSFCQNYEIGNAFFSIPTTLGGESFGNSVRTSALHEPLNFKSLK
ncbi:MAG: hypothetical protein PHP66_09550 [Syntrophales bacterium]|nr:hypothetical protein [Syntrophales bacterium]